MEIFILSSLCSSILCLYILYQHTCLIIYIFKHIHLSEGLDLWTCWKVFWNVNSIFFSRFKVNFLVFSRLTVTKIEQSQYTPSTPSYQEMYLCISVFLMILTRWCLKYVDNEMQASPMCFITCKTLLADDPATKIAKDNRKFPA